MTAVRAVRALNDGLVAPGATRSELVLTYTTASAGTVLAVVLADRAGLGVLATVVSAVVAFDLFGGAVANAVPSGSRRWHGPHSSAARHLGFVALHVQPLLLALVHRDYEVGSAALLYGATLLAAVAVLAAPPELRRAVALSAVSLGVGLFSVVAVAPADLAWLVPVLLTKLLVAHLSPGAEEADRDR
ncbi:hypothetical protein [Blastococcus sp. SYSU D00820]